MKATGMNLIGVKESNRALLLQLICTSGAITRSELSARSRLSPMTVTNITAEFLLRRIITEEVSQDAAKTPGRIPMLLSIAPESPVIGGIFVARNCLYGTVGDMSLNLLAKESIPLGPAETESSVLEKLTALANMLRLATPRPMLGLGVSTAGVVNEAKSAISFITDFYNIHALDIGPCLSQALGLPVFVYNDMQASGLAELYFGMGKTASCFLYVGVCSGIGASVVTNNELLSASGEIGHMCIDWTGPRCACGSNGCLELYASTPSILRQIREECGVALPSLEKAVEYSLTNKNAYAVLYNAAQKLSFAINNYLNLLNVPVVIFGHDAYALPDELILRMQERVARICVGVHRGDMPLRFCKSAFGSDAPLYGAICVVLEQLFRNKYPLLDKLPVAAS